MDFMLRRVRYSGFISEYEWACQFQLIQKMLPAELTVLIFLLLNFVIVHICYYYCRFFIIFLCEEINTLVQILSTLNLSYLTSKFRISAVHVIVYFQEMFYTFRSQDNVLGIATGYGLDERQVGVRVPVESRIFSSRRHPVRLWGPLNLLSNGYRVLFLRR
jgi:hypothetical protein